MGKISRIIVLIALSLVIYVFGQQPVIAGKGEVCKYAHSDEGAHYYILNKAPSYNNNRLLAKIPMSSIDIETNGSKRVGYIGIGFNDNDTSKGNQTAFIDITLRFYENKIYAYIYGNTIKPNTGMEEMVEIGSFANHKIADNLKFVDIDASLRYDSSTGNSWLDVVYTPYDGNFKPKTPIKFQRYIAGYFKYNVKKKLFNVNPYQFVSLMPAKNQVTGKYYPITHNDGTYLNGTIGISRYDATAGQVPYKLEEGITLVSTVCTKNMSGPNQIADGSSYLTQNYSFKIHNDDTSFPYTGSTQ